MGTADIQEGRLVEFYHRYVGEPESKRDVYGYWIFLVGCLAVFLGVAIFLAGELVQSRNFGTRQYAIPLAAGGAAVGLLGIIVLLPVRRRGMQASVVGMVVALAAMIPFWFAYPGDWNVGTLQTAVGVAIYSAGVGIMIGVAILVPIVTGEKGLFVEPELGIDSDEPPILLGRETEDAFFAVFETEHNDWAWRVIRRDAVGEAVERLPSDTDARMAIDDVREKIGDAGLLELTTAAFRLYRTEDGEWRWSLVREDGSVLAESETPYPSRDDAESTVNVLKESAPGASVVEIRDAAFDLSRDERGHWHWRLVDDERRPLASGPETYEDEGAASSATGRFVDVLDDARVLTVESLAVELYGDEAGWRWRVLDADDRALLTSDATFDSRRDAEAAANDTAQRLDGATVVERGRPGFEVYALGDEYHWRLRDASDDLIASSSLAAASEQGARTLAGRVRDAVGGADVLEFEGADFEVYPRDGAYHWRLVAEDRTLLADSTVATEELDDAREAADRVREQALAADLIEFEQAAFQQYESDGEWRWRLIDEDGQVMADSGEEYGSREEVVDGMTTLKEHAPDAEVLEIETAAFEIYRTDDGEYAWRLIDETGKLIAEGAKDHPSRAAARDAVDFILEHLDDAAVRRMEDAVFQLGRDEDGDWRWWLVDTDGSVLGEGTERYPTRDDAIASIDDVRTAGAGADIDAVGDLFVQLRETGGWRFRVVDRDRESVATGERTYEDWQAATGDVRRLTGDAAEAPVFELGDGVVWIDDRDGWQWRLLDEDRVPVAEAAQAYETRDAVHEAVETIRSRAPDAGTLEFEEMAFERYRDETDAWRWRLIDEDERVRAVSAAGYEHRDDLDDAIDEARDQVTGASILEIDEAAFEFHEHRGGWIWRLVDENGEALAESVEPHDTRSEAREQMLAVKAHGPDGETVVTW